MVEQRSKSDRIRAKIRRTKAKIKGKILVPQNFVLLAIPVLIIVWFVGTILLLNRIWELQEEVGSRNLERQRLALEIDTLALENQYQSSDEYQELAARRLLNKQLPGETMIYLPPNSDAAKNKYSTVVVEEKTPEASNFEQWMTYLFGK